MKDDLKRFYRLEAKYEDDEAANDEFEDIALASDQELRDSDVDSMGYDPMRGEGVQSSSEKKTTRSNQTPSLKWRKCRKEMKPADSPYFTWTGTTSRLACCSRH